jgi:CRP-like cAMP-binding protein
VAFFFCFLCELVLLSTDFTLLPMFASNSPKLPSGQQMRQMQLPPVAQEQIHIIALQVLQRLFEPLVRRCRLRKARLLLQRQYIAECTSAGDVETAVVNALQHISFLGAVTREIGTTTSQGNNASNAAADGVARSPTSSHEGLPHPTSPSASVSLPAVDLTAAAEIREQVRAAMTAHLVHLSVHLQDEIVEWEWEPASEVLILLAGTVERRGSAVAVTRAMSASPFAVGPGGSAPGTRRQSAATAAHVSSRTGSLSYGRPAGGSRRGSASGLGNASLNTSLAATTRSLPRRASGGVGAEAPFTAPGGGGGRPFTSSSAFQGGGGGGSVLGNADAQMLAAPQVFGELACLGAFPYCAMLSVVSPTALLLRIPKEVYCKLVSQCVAVEGQRRLLVEALQMRERLMPYYAPLTSARLLLCPLLTHLRPEQLEHIRDLAIPRVYAAGMECGEKDSPHHIFFIRRGVVQMQRDGGNGWGAAPPPPAMGGLGAGSVAASEFSSRQAVDTTARASYSLGLPKNRSVLVEGHTYGETGCIFGDALGDRYTAVTHVDMYLLPFQVLIQLMKQVPEVQSTIYRSAQELSFLRDKEWPGVLFGPQQFGVELPDVHGIVPAQGLLANMAATPAAQNADWHSTGYSRTTRGCSVGINPLGHPGGAAGAPRRVTIFEDVSADRTANAERTGDATSGGGGGGLTGGRVSTALLTAMEQLPVVSLLPSFSADFAKECTQQWQCVTYTKGDVIAAAGQECSRLLLFFEGRAGVVRNAAQLREELHPGPFGVADINSVGSDVVCPIPAGHVVGYTCVRRHRWTNSIVALDDVVEVWEMRRNTFVQLLRTHGMEREMQTASLQLLQPLAVQKDRLAVLDYQPLLHPMPNSLWRQQAVPNVHPVVAAKEGTVCFPVWREGDFPLDRRASVADISACSGSGGGRRRSTLTAVSSVRVAAIANERQRSAGQRVGDSPKLASQRPSSAFALSESDSGARTSFMGRLASAA